MDNLEKWFSRTIETEDGCLIWQGAVNSDGYARVAWKGSGNGKLHRIVYELTTGEDIEGKVIRHKCDNPLCINPEHLTIGSHTDNMRDRDERERHGKAKLTHEEVREIRRLDESGQYRRVQIARMFNIDPRTVSSLCNYHHWKHVT